VKATAAGADRDRAFALLSGNAWNIGARSVPDRGDLWRWLGVKTTAPMRLLGAARDAVLGALAARSMR